ncbi:MAG: serine hydrolase domain-containing protein [Planctomycetota bacterium]|jgi:CubicO group peptidase (beta-lactamase class C family)
MIQLRSLICVVLVVLALPLSAAELPTAKPEDVGMSSAKLTKVDDVMNELVEKEKLAGGIVMIARHGKVVHFKPYGLADREAKRPMTTDAIMRFYSMSKAITSAGIMILADEGKLNVDDSVTKFIPSFANLKVDTEDGLVAPERMMTVADLLRHTSGFSYGGSRREKANAAHKKADPTNYQITLEEMAERLAGVPTAFHPGEDWIYGVSIDVLGRIIEVAADQPLDRFLRKRIFKPLDMPDTGFFVPEEKHGRFAQVYNSDGNGKLTIGDNAAGKDFTRPRTFLSGGGGLVSTARDYMRFLMMIQQGGQLGDTRILSPKSVRLMTTNQLPEAVPHIYFGQQRRVGVGFGFGFSVRDKMSDWDPQGRVGEYGWGGAASTHYWVSPKDDLIVITLEQTWPYSFMTEFAVKGLIYDAIEE